jgi:type II secretory pathway pseudopilin PulG
MAYSVLSRLEMIFNNRHKRLLASASGFTLVEGVFVVALIGIGVAGTLTALTKANSIASMSRNSTGAQTVAQNEIDRLLAYQPFNPQKMNATADCDGVVRVQVPKDYNSICAGNAPTYDLTVGTHVVQPVAIYKEPTTGVIVSGTMTTVIQDVSPTYAPTGAVVPVYRATVTIDYTYLNRTYKTTMSTLRVSDI